MPQDPNKSELAKSLRAYTEKYPRRSKIRPKRGLPRVLPPPSGMPMPFMLGADTARYLRMLQDLDPLIAEGVSSVSTGPNSARIASLLKENPELLGVGRRAVPNTNSLGTFNLKDESVYLNPRLRGEALFQTLAHELSHGAGTNEESADRIGQQAADFYEANLSQKHMRMRRENRSLALDSFRRRQVEK